MASATTEEELAVKELLVLVLNNFHNMVKMFTKFKGEEGLRRVRDKAIRTVSCDEVFANIYIGNVGAAKDKVYLKEQGITHVLNTSEGKKGTQVDTNQEYYQDVSIKYLGLELLDEPTTNISVHFNQTTDFIEEALNSGGKVLVHCFMGMSRSATCVLAYLIIKHNMTPAQALTQVREHRFVCPNEGFLLQLVQLDSKLKAERCGNTDVASSL